jgi:hypothetical protein
MHSIASGVYSCYSSPMFIDSGNDLDQTDNDDYEENMIGEYDTMAFEPEPTEDDGMIEFQVTLRSWDDVGGSKGMEVVDTNDVVIAYTRDGNASIYLVSMGGHEVTLSQEQAHDLCEALQLLL